MFFQNSETLLQKINIENQSLAKFYKNGAYFFRTLKRKQHFLQQDVSLYVQIFAKFALQRPLAFFAKRGKTSELSFIFSIEKKKLSLKKRARADVHSVKTRAKKKVE